MKLVEFYNQCPDCLSMAIAIIPIEGFDQEYDLYLSYQFNEQKESLFEGEITFSVKSCLLKIDFKNVLLIENFTNQDINYCDNYSWQINNINPDKNVVSPTKKIKLAKVKINGDSYACESQFIVKAEEISLTQIEGLWKHNLTPNKHGVLDRKIAKFIHQYYFEPYGCKITFSSSDFSLPTNNISEEKQAFLNIIKSDLKSIIENIYNTEKNDLLILVKMAKLDILTDLVGGNFVGANLTGINLNKANLKNINFRGADLTDADLSESNLSYAKLNGADLSGAYVENANLQGVNFTNASLALANLIGSNLEGANFTKTNLTSTSFANTSLKEAMFVDNIGLTPENKQILISKGAIFLVT